MIRSPASAGLLQPAGARVVAAIQNVRAPCAQRRRWQGQSKAGKSTGCAGSFQSGRQAAVTAETDETTGDAAGAREGQLCLVAGGEDRCGYFVRAVGYSDIQRCGGLMSEVGFDSSTRDWDMIIRHCKDDVYGIFHRDEMVGVVSATPYPAADSGAPAFGWIGNVVVHPEYRSKGLASMLLNYGIRYLKKQHRCDRILLDASSMGKPVYNKLGFRDHALVHRMRATDLELALGWATSSSQGQSSEGGVVCTSQESLGDVLDFDRTAFGGDRGSLLEQWIRHIPGSSLHSRDSDGAVSGFSFTHTREECDYIGPVVAKDPAVAAELLRGSLLRLLQRRRSKQIVVLVLQGSQGTLSNEEEVALGTDWASELSRSAGFVCDETTTRQVMVTSGASEFQSHPGNLGLVIACGSLDLG